MNISRYIFNKQNIASINTILRFIYVIIDVFKNIYYVYKLRKRKIELQGIIN